MAGTDLKNEHVDLRANTWMQRASIDIYAVSKHVICRNRNQQTLNWQRQKTDRKRLLYTIDLVSWGITPVTRQHEATAEHGIHDLHTPNMC